ncbi:hypothetical protein CsatA_004243 [Cannabis sativa]
MQSHKEAAPFKIKSFPWYDDLCAVFGKDRATGKHAETVARMIMQDNALVSYFFSVPDDEKDEWARLLIDGSL